MMKLTLRERAPETHDTVNFFWEPEQPIDFAPGQFMRWSLPHENPDDRGTTRFFSIASSPTEELIRLTTKFSPKGSSFKRALYELQHGDTIEATGPMGSFTIDSDPGDELILVAGGIGITPFRSMLKFMHDGELFIPINLVYACRTPQDVAFKDLLSELEEKHHNLQVTYDFSGRLTGETIKQIGGASSATKEVFLSGPEPMIKALKEQLLALSHPEDLIKTDYFPGYTII